MAFLSSADDALAALVHQEPLRFTGTLPLISTRFTPPVRRKVCCRGSACYSASTPPSPAV